MEECCLSPCRVCSYTNNTLHLDILLDTQVTEVTVQVSVAFVKVSLKIQIQRQL